jgi:hypothetical protein
MRKAMLLLAVLGLAGSLSLLSSTQLTKKGILINELATHEIEVQFDKKDKDMARNINYSSRRCLFYSIFFRKNKGIKSDTTEQDGRSRTSYTPA